MCVRQNGTKLAPEPICVRFAHTTMLSTRRCHLCQKREIMTELIAMLTHDDKTVANARAVFESAVDAPTEHWGFKDTGLPAGELALLARDMKKAGKVVHFESLEEDESACLTAARLAVDEGIDYLIGMAFHQSVADVLSGAGVRYFPTCGGRSGVPRMLHGAISEVVADAQSVRSKADGVTLSLYRWTDGNPADLGEAFLRDVASPIIVTGSINSTDRLDEISRLAPWGITVGSAIFDDVFGIGSFGGSLEWMRNYLDTSQSRVS